MKDSVSLSHRLYRFLLRAYPPSFYAEYGDEMALTFRDSCRAEYRRHGAAGVIGRWVETVPDFIVSVLDEHSQENFQMAKTNLVRILAVAGIVGGALWVAFSVILFMRPPGIPGGASQEASDFTPLLLFGVGLGTAGLLGAYLRPGRQWPILSRLMLLLGVAGGLWAVISPAFTNSFYIMLAGFLVQVGGLALAGLLLLAQSASRQWAVLFIGLAAAMFMFNTEDWRALFGVVAGALVIAISAQVLDGSLNGQNEPPVAA
ncbi:MAG: hypothetical protein HYZ49_20655 [Chloroflexi bacterium]|nr:hypothetical protein [Chloroflexota bacterium]